MLARRFRSWVAPFAAVLISCSPAAGEPIITPSIPPAATPQPPSQAPATLPAQAPGKTRSWVEQAMADLAARLGVPASEIEVVSAEAVTWNDGSLGCPQPGMAYIQVLIDGFRVILKHGDKTYDYHAGPSSIFLCEQPRAVPYLCCAHLKTQGRAAFIGRLL